MTCNSTDGSPSPQYVIAIVPVAPLASRTRAWTERGGGMCAQRASVPSPVPSLSKTTSLTATISEQRTWRMPATKCTPPSVGEQGGYHRTCCAG